ncbi:mitochondrial import inner membrane translocase subunit Tim21-like [Tigriopus californicus]|uniref:mitochondrial import inner membrane translocase subunit Tim21-like n=1 Tax=Tigriopus californicus TaxID=6832 RepID=UPI0027DA16C6|nr:mitochondrial import inner membrane translocase subunit Tim21-like [Tigriopus californicus]
MSHFILHATGRPPGLLRLPLTVCLPGPVSPHRLVKARVAARLDPGLVQDRGPSLLAGIQRRGLQCPSRGVFSSGRPGSDTPAPVEPDATANQTLQVGFKEKAKENVKTATYGSVIVIGVGITAVVLYTVFSELFSSSSPVKLFQMASEKCVQHPRVQDLLGEPIKAFGEETRRGRRRHVSHVEYVDKEGRKGIRVQFYLQGLRKRGTAQIDAREDESGSMKTRFIIVTADDLLATSVVVEDNR